MFFGRAIRGIRQVVVRKVQPHWEYQEELWRPPTAYLACDRWANIATDNDNVRARQAFSVRPFRGSVTFTANGALRQGGYTVPHDGNFARYTGLVQVAIRSRHVGKLDNCVFHFHRLGAFTSYQ